MFCPGKYECHQFNHKKWFVIWLILSRWLKIFVKIILFKLFYSLNVLLRQLFILIVSILTYSHQLHLVKMVMELTMELFPNSSMAGCQAIFALDMCVVLMINLARGLFISLSWVELNWDSFLRQVWNWNQIWT